MSPHLRLATVFLFAVLLGSCSGPSPSGDFHAEDVSLDVPAQAGAYVPTLDGPLRILSATPNGPMLGMAEHQTVTVTFSKPMVPLGGNAEVPAGTLTLVPDVGGTLRWDGAQTLVLMPEEPLPPATAFRARLGAGLTSLDGEALEEPYTWTFETPRPAVVSTVPRAGAPYVDPAQSIFVHFNQAVDAAAASAFVELARRSGRSRYDVSIAVDNDGDSTLVIDPRALLPKGSQFEVLLREGLPAAGGSLGMADTTTVAFSTYGDLAFVFVDQPRLWWEEDRPGIDPERGLTLHFSTPVRFGDLRKALSFDPPVELPAGIEAQDDRVGAQHVIPPVWQPETRYTVTVRNLKDTFGQKLDEARQTFTTRAFTPSIHVATGLMVIEAYERAAIPIKATNVQTLRLGTQRLAQDDIVPLLRLYDSEHYYGERPDDAPALPEVMEARRRLDLDVPRNQPTVTALRLDSLMHDSTGVVAFRALAPQVPGQQGREYRGLAQVTRMGLTAKFSAHQDLIFVTALKTGEPIEGANVTIRDNTNQVRWQGYTDEAGRALAPGWAALGIEKSDPWSRPVQFAIVEKDGDVAFTSSVYDDGLEPYRFDVSYDWSPEPVTEQGSVFTDRGLYRAGEAVHVKAILRQKTDADWQPVTDSVRVLVSSPRDAFVMDQAFLPSDLGTFDFEWPAPASADQGVYTVRVVHTADTTATQRGPWEEGDVARGTFRVDAFRTATFEVNATAAAGSYVAGDFFEGTVGGRYLFGAPMGGQQVRYILRREPGYYAPPGYDDYRFGHFSTSGSLYQNLASDETTLDADGTVTLRHQVPGNEDGASATLVWTGTVTDPSEQQITARTEVTLHPGLFYVGLRPQTTFLDVSRDDEMTVDVITVDPAGAPVSDKDVTVALVKRQWHSVREVGTDGRLRWRSELNEEVLGTSEITTAAGQAKRLTMPVTEGGSYVIRATARDMRGNAIRSEAYFYATGAGYVAWERRDDDRIDLIPERDTYRPGETARFMLQSPYEEATALITVEREGILSSRVETLRGSAPQIEVPLTEEHLPNVYVSVILVKGRMAQASATADPGAPSFKIGYAGIRVDPGQRHLTVEIEPDEETYRPGDEVTVALRLRNQEGDGVPGEIAFSAADAGVLNLINYRLPDPFDTFYGDVPLGVTTTETRADIVEQRNFGQKAEDVIGGGGDSDFLLRQDFRPLAHWDPAIRTDDRGRATVTFRLPESLTTFRLMATALTAHNDFGAGYESIVVTQPLVLQPALPRFARLEDTFEAGVLVTNTTGAAGEAQVTAQAQGLDLLDDATKTVTLADGATKVVRFRWTAAASGEAQLTFEATLGEEKDAFTTPLRITRPTTKHVSATFASVDDGARNAIALPDDRVPSLGSFDVQVSSTALVGLEGATQYLFDYPYGCIEQRTSRVRPLLVASDVLDAFDLQALDGDRDTVIREWLAGLRDFWTSEGFSMWPGGYHAMPYVSAYVVLALAEARDAGYVVPDDIDVQAAALLAEQVRRRSDRPEYYSAQVWNDTRAFMLYALVRHGTVLTAEIDQLAQGGDLSLEGKSILLRTIALANDAALDAYRRPLVDELMAQVRVEGTGAYLYVPDTPAYRWIFASNARATAHGLTALIEASPDPSPELRQLAARMVRYLMQSRSDGHWTSTQENVAVVDAFRAYFDAFERAAPRFTAEVRLAGQRLLVEDFNERTLKVATAERPLSALPSQQSPLPVEVTKTGTGTLYYAMQLETYSTAPQEAANHGISVERRIQRLDETGQPRGEALLTGGSTVTLAAGDLVRVTLRVSTSTDRSYVAVDDALPAGLEALNAAFATTNQDVLEQAGAGQNRWWGSFDHTELKDDRVLLFADFLRRGEHTYTYVARATTPGTFVHPSVQAEAMYEPAINGRTATGTVVVQPPPEETAMR